MHMSHSLKLHKGGLYRGLHREYHRGALRGKLDYRAEITLQLDGLPLEGQGNPRVKS